MSTDTIDYALNFDDAQQSDADKKLLVMFYRDTVKNETKSIEAGRPIFDEIDLVKIITPGSRDSFVGDANHEYQMRFASQWARYKANMDQTLGSGTPLSQLPWMTTGQIAEFNAVGCKTIEQLVGMSDNLSQKFMGHHQIKQRAQTYLDAAAGVAPTLRLEAELSKRDEQIANLQSQIDAMMAIKLKAATPSK